MIRHFRLHERHASKSNTSNNSSTKINLKRNPCLIRRRMGSVLFYGEGGSINKTKYVFFYKYYSSIINYDNINTLTVALDLWILCFPLWHTWPMSVINNFYFIISHYFITTTIFLCCSDSTIKRILLCLGNLFYRMKNCFPAPKWKKRIFLTFMNNNNSNNNINNNHNNNYLLNRYYI